jgi:DbpA RNA binding domain
VTERLDAVAVGTEAAPPVETTEAPSKVDDVARAVLDRKSKRDAKRTAPTEETREFWETWAEEKTTREPAAATSDATDADADAGDDAGEADTEARPSRSKSSDKSADKARDSKDRGRGSRDSKDRGRGSRTKSDTKVDKPEKKAADKPEKADKEERGSRGKRDTVPNPPAAVDGAQARLFISLGKKHGVSADDLRELLGGALGGDKARIGSVSLRDSHAHVRVPEDLADKIIKGVHGTQHNDHEVTVERARA